MRRYSFFLLLFLSACNSNRPNVVCIIVDDLGWMDTGAYGSTFYQTPHIDQLASDGTLFTQFYASSPVCSPTRASIMTGKHPARLQITNQIGGVTHGRLLQADYLRALPLEEVTIGDVFQQAGYNTAYIGKWHLGTGDFRPENQGFGTVLASNDAGEPGSYFAPYTNENFPALNVPDLETDIDSTYLTDRLTDLAIDFISSEKENPFFLVLSHYSVHSPLQAKPQEVQRFSTADTAKNFIQEALDSATRTTQNDATYAAMIASVDESIGRILQALENSGIRENTIVIFTSDNGGLSTLSEDLRWAPTSNRPLRAGKGWLYEGGIRIPLIIDGLSDMPKTMDVLGTTDDLLPSIASLAGIRLLEPVDGIDLFGASVPDRLLYWHFPHYPGTANRPSGAIRHGRYKVIEWFEDDSAELYDLESDPEETTDISQFEPGITQDLLQRLRTWRDTVDARMPRPNPDYVDVGLPADS